MTTPNKALETKVRNEKILRELLGKSGIFKEAMAIMKGELLLDS